MKTKSDPERKGTLDAFEVFPGGCKAEGGPVLVLSGAPPEYVSGLVLGKDHKIGDTSLPRRCHDRPRHGARLCTMTPVEPVGHRLPEVFPEEPFRESCKVLF